MSEETHLAEVQTSVLLVLRSSRWMWRFSTFSMTGRIRRTPGALVFWFLSFIIVLLTFRSLGLHFLLTVTGHGVLLCKALNE